MLPKPTKRKPSEKRSLRQVKSQQAIATSEPPLRDPKYRQWLRHFVCEVKNGKCHGEHQNWQWQDILKQLPKVWFYVSQHAHNDKAVSGREKIGDDKALPLCDYHHREQEPDHDAFDLKYGLNRHRRAAAYYQRYLEERDGNE